MKSYPRWMRVVMFAVLVVAVQGCRATVQEPAPAVAAPSTAERAVQNRAGAPSEADVRFMQHMISHHAQALEMTALVPTRSQSEAIRRLATRIEVSQMDEIALMQQWLRQRGADVPHLDGHSVQGHEGADHAPMPGMLTHEEIARLASASGAGFDRRFLESMIRHHEGALIMVAKLFAAPGAAQDSQVFRLASDVDADQRAEIARMQRLLETAAAGGGR